jgi:hypothetical protein
MGNTLKMAVRTMSVCLLCVVATRQPIAAQQPTATQPQPPAQPPPASQQAAQQQPAPLPPPPVITPAGQFNGGDGWSLTVQEWAGVGHPVMGTGHSNTSGYPSNLDYGGQARPSPGAELTIPLGKQQRHAIHASYFRVQGTSNPISPDAPIIFGTSYLQGDLLAVHYTMQNVKVGLDYLSWPFPIKDSKFHIKTLYEINYTTILTSVDAPLRHGETDASGNPIETNGQGTDWFVYPSFGLGVDYLITHKLRFEARASGFIFPHRSTIYDVEASLMHRFGKFEVQAGLKTFHFKTSPAGNEFVQATYPGIYVGFRWYPEYSSR